MKKVKIWAIVLCVTAVVIRLSGVVIDLAAIDGDSESASPWHEILGDIIFAISIVLAIIYALKADEHKGNKGNWFLIVLTLFPAYLIITAIIDIVNL